MNRIVCALTVAGLLLASSTSALVHYDQGRREVLGVQLLQTVEDPSVYQYVPTYPQLSTKEDGTLELLCLKYVDPQGGTSGGLLHALVQFTLPPEVVARLEKELQKDIPGATIAGPVPLLPATGEETRGGGSFQVVSAVLSDQEEGGFTRSLITSGTAPVTPGSKAVVAAILEPQGATLLWDSLTGPTSDVSVAIHAAYEAQVRAYNARVSAEMDTLYQHLSRISNNQRSFSRRQTRRIVDELVQSGDLKVEVFDRTKAFGLKADDLEAVLQLVTDKLTELMFDAESGWAQEPPREAAVEMGQIPGRRKSGWFSRVFGGEKNPQYVTDDQYVLKRRQDIRRHRFSLVLDKATTVRVPVDTAGNLGGLYQELSTDERYFRVVDLTDPDFEVRSVHFQVDGGYLEAFEDTLNFVSVNFRKRYEDRPAVTRTLTFSHGDVSGGQTVQEVSFARLGQQSADWTEFEYQVVWGLKDRPSLRVPEKEEEWITSRDAAVSLVPPFRKRLVEIDADRDLFAPQDIRSAVVELMSVLAGEARLDRKIVLRAADPEPTAAVTLYHDPEEPVGMRVSWYAPKGQKRGDVQLLDSDYLFLTPPDLGFEEEEQGEAQEAGEDGVSEGSTEGVEP